LSSQRIEPALLGCRINQEGDAEQDDAERKADQRGLHDEARATPGYEQRRLLGGDLQSPVVERRRKTAPDQVIPRAAQTRAVDAAVVLVDDVVAALAFLGDEERRENLPNEVARVVVCDEVMASALVS